MSAIGIKIKKAEEERDPGASKFFGAPAIPSELKDMFSDDVILLYFLRRYVFRI